MNKRIKARPRKKTNPTVTVIDPNELKRERMTHYAAIALLMGFGIWMSVHYFGFLISPCPDFPCFTQLAHQLWSFHLPTEYKRAPVHGSLVLLFSLFTQSSQHPDLTAGRILCATLYPLTIVLMYLVGCKFIGRWAIWPALISAIHPWVIQSLVDPVAEMTLLFFTLVTFFFLLRRSRWTYLFASITTMVRYEGAALILAAFIWDMIESRNMRERIKTFVFAAIATVPLMLWAIGTMLSWKNADVTHYVKEMGAASGGKFVFFEFIDMLWRSGFSMLFIPSPSAQSDTVDALFGLNKFLLFCSFGFGLVYGLIKRNWKVLMLVIFLLPYICIHAAHSFLVPRFGVPVNWLILLMSLYGFQSLFRVINKNNRIPVPIIVCVQIIAAVMFCLWFVDIYPYLKEVAPAARNSVPLPYVVLGIAAAFAGISAYFHRYHFALADSLIIVMLGVIVVSNQFPLAGRIGNGDTDIEFKYLTDWYIQNAKPGEKLLCSMAGNMGVFAPRHADKFVHVSGIKASNPQEFVQKCYDANLTYIVWDARVGNTAGSRYYGLWHIENMAMLSKPRSIGPYEYITTLKSNDDRRYVHLFKLKPLQSSLIGNK